MRRISWATRGLAGAFGLLTAACAKNAGEAAPASSTSTGTSSQVIKLEDLSFVGVAKLDREKSIFFLTFGNLEVHGPELPIGTDYFQAISVRDGLIGKLRAAHPTDNFVIVPVVPLGEGGAEELAGQEDHVGTFHVRYQTLRNVAIDLGSSIARKGFKHILVVHAHGGPLHNVAFTEAAAFVSEKFHVSMVNLTSMVFAQGYVSPTIMNKYLGNGWEDRGGFEAHGGAAETSVTMFLRPELVSPAYKDLHPFVVHGPDEFARTSERTGWNGYWGDPSKASAAMGKELFEDVVERTYRLAEKSLAGEDLSKLPHHPVQLPPSFDRIEKGVLERDAQHAAEIKAWLERRQAGTKH